MAQLKQPGSTALPKIPSVRGRRVVIDSELAKLKAKVVGTNDPQVLQRKMGKLVEAINQPFGAPLVSACNAQGSCITAIDGAAPALLRNAKFAEGVDAWDSY